ncbi:MAG: hypothetical protein ACK4Y6_00455 [Bacteroidota bacterium]|jgi:hypothetical protein
MRKLVIISVLLCSVRLSAQQDSARKSILLIPYQQMMHFSDADQDIARFSKTDPNTVRQTLRNELDINIYHQLLAHFNVISIMRSATLNGEYDLNRIYAATRYTLYKKTDQESYHEAKPSGITEKLKNFTKSIARKNKEQTFWTNDSSVMLADIGDKELFPYLTRKYKCNYLLFITQFEITTNNKNTIEWLKQEYSREYMIHYNLFDPSGHLLRAETLTIKASNENKLSEIKSKYLIVLAQRLRDIIKVIND